MVGNFLTTCICCRTVRAKGRIHSQGILSLSWQTLPDLSRLPGPHPHPVAAPSLLEFSPELLRASESFAPLGQLSGAQTSSIRDASDYIQVSPTFQQTPQKKNEPQAPSWESGSYRSPAGGRQPALGPLSQRRPLSVQPGSLLRTKQVEEAAPARSVMLRPESCCLSSSGTIEPPGCQCTDPTPRRTTHTVLASWCPHTGGEDHGIKDFKGADEILAGEYIKSVGERFTTTISMGLC